MTVQVLVLGMPRTGTQSIGEALRLLGHSKVYHMTTVGPNAHHDRWVAALEAKFEGKGEPFGKKEFDELLDGYDVTSDFPSSIFYRELMAAYPSARLVLTTRSEDAWYDSMAKTLYHAYSKAQAAPSRLAKMYNVHMWGDDFLAHGREAFRKHNEGVQRAAAELGREVLVFDPSQGWESLCGFLGKPVPAVAYPCKDMWAGYKDMLKEVEAGRLTEDSLIIKGRGTTIPNDKIKSAYIYTQSPNDSLPKPATNEGIKAAYIYTQSPNDGDHLPKPSPNEGIKAAYIYTQSPNDNLPKPSSGEGIKAAYIYTQSPNDNLPKPSNEGMKAAYIYTQSPNDNLPKPTTNEVIKAAYIYTQSPNDKVKAASSEGIKAAYIYTQSPNDSDKLPKPSSNEGIKAAYIYTQNGIVKATEEMKAAYDYTQAIPGFAKDGIKAAYIYTQ